MEEPVVGRELIGSLATSLPKLGEIQTLPILISVYIIRKLWGQAEQMSWQ